MSIYTLESLFITLKVHAEADSKDFHEFLPNPYTYNFDRFTPLNVRLHDKRDTPYTQKDLRVVYTLWSHSLLPWKSVQKLIAKIYKSDSRVYRQLPSPSGYTEYLVYHAVSHLMGYTD